MASNFDLIEKQISGGYNAQVFHRLLENAAAHYDKSKEYSTGMPVDYSFDLEAFRECRKEHRKEVLSEAHH